MNLQMRWVGADERERVALTRARCYAPGERDGPRFLELLDTDGRVGPKDYLLAESDGAPVGTATHYPLSMWLGGGRVACQGVGWVGAIKTHRRLASPNSSRSQTGDASAPGRRGVASQVMAECLRAARERECVVSALMPFRGSFYEHFGYGIVERHAVWSAPMSILPTGDFDGIRFMTADDRPAMEASHQRIVERGQCDIERTPASWNIAFKQWEAGWTAVDPDPAGGIRGSLAFTQFQKDEKDFLQVSELDYCDLAGLQRWLHFLAAMRDQYHGVVLTLPADVPLNRMLNEHQLPHRLVNHAHAKVHLQTRMSMRVLNHRQLIEAMQFDDCAEGHVVVEVRESEGHRRRLGISWSAGRAQVKTVEASADVVCPDHVWASIVGGDLAADLAGQMGLIEVNRIGAERELLRFCRGGGFCREYF